MLDLYLTGIDIDVGYIINVPSLKIMPKNEKQMTY
jgi:hypothetical protein